MIMYRVQVHVEGAMDDEVFFAKLAQEEVSIDIINIFPNRRVFTIDADKKEKALEVIKEHAVSHYFIDNCCKVTVIGERMTGVPGVMAKIIKSLASENIEILQTADSLSTIACLIRQQDLKKSIAALHQAFDLN
jgi:aspartate kinase